MMHIFKTYHPLVNFLYFVFVIGFAVCLMHPIFLGISLVCGVLYLALLRGGHALKKQFLFAVPLLLFTAILNPLFSHAGITVLTYLPSGNPLTLESVVYGLCAAAMLAAVLAWFACFQQIMSSDKFIYLFGRIMPSLSLVLSMTLRFVPRVLGQLKQILNAQKCLGRDASVGNLIQRAKNGLHILSALLTQALENAVETADGMRARGYGLPNRTAFSVFKWEMRDKCALCGILLLGVGTLVLCCYGGAYFRFYPSLKGANCGAVYGAAVALYACLCAYPIGLEMVEVIKWKFLNSKM